MPKKSKISNISDISGELGKLTDNQKEVIIYWDDYFKSHRCNPNIKEYSDASGLSYTAAWARVNACVKKNWLDRKPNGSIVLTDQAANKVEMAVLEAIRIMKNKKNEQ